MRHTFPDKLKFADIFPIYKQDKVSRSESSNYRPVSVLPYSSKLFERILKQQIQSSMDNILSEHLCGYREGYSAHHALISMLEKWRKALDQRGYAAAILMDLSKAFDCMNHELLLAKLNAYGCDRGTLETLEHYLKNRWQRVKVNSAFSEWSELTLGVPQGSVLGPILFNIYLNDLLWFIEDSDVCNYADDTTIYVCSKDLQEIKRKLEASSNIAIKWFHKNYMKLNSGKCKLIICGSKSHPMSIKVGDSEIKEQDWVKLLGVKL